MKLEELKAKYISQALDDISMQDAIENLSLYMFDEYKGYSEEVMLDMLEDSGYAALIDEYKTTKEK
tara:strand:- start:255 stop:452 length:198 start_codon:yes stop_codon:yes gene_type:complete